MTIAKQNRSGFFYGEGSLSANYSDNSFNFKGFTSKIIRIIATGADCEFSIIGGGAGGANDVDGKVKAGEDKEFTNMEACKLALRGAGSSVRVWAY